uniref:Uncharacterized protein n=1 Tax=Molossus molossus TaxID=27622 RepID=A0A7J8JVM5_MOLMO|nr:hypothetical protein HJG59_007985 [Molossus molossus]
MRINITCLFGPTVLHRETTQEGKDAASALGDSWIKEGSSARYMHGIAINRYALERGTDTLGGVLYDGKSRETSMVRQRGTDHIGPSHHQAASVAGKNEADLKKRGYFGQPHTEFQLTSTVTRGTQLKKIEQNPIHSYRERERV